jgi:hypothetical protein
MGVFIPQGCKTSRSIPACRILKNCISTDLLETLNNIIVEYFFYLDKINWLYIFKKRFGLNGNQPVLLSDIGKEYNITRERTRQILFIMTSQIRKLLEGKELSKPRIVCKKINLFESFKNSLTSKIYTFDRIKRVLVENYTKISADYYIDLLMFLYGYEIISYENKKIYYKDISFFKIKKNIHLFRVFLSKRALFVSQNEIKNAFKLTPQELEFYLEFISNIETKEVNGEIFYRMPLKDLQRSSIRVYRILYEAGHPMQISDIETELIKNGCKVDIGRLCLTVKKYVNSIVKYNSLNESKGRCM